MARWRTAIRIRGGALLALAVLAAAAGAVMAQPATEGLVAQTAPPDLFLLHSGDVIGYLGPCG
jgi:hypothetical protein